MYYTMVEHWKEHGPPVYRSVAAYLQMTGKGGAGDAAPTTSREAKDSRYGNLEELAAMFGDTGGVIQ